MALGDGTTWDETNPTNNTTANQIDDYNRDLRIGIRSRMAFEHEWPASQAATSEAGRHKFITLQVQGTQPTLSGTQIGAIYIKTSGTENALYAAINSAEVQLIAGTSPLGNLVSGDLLLSVNSGTRAGFTLITSTYEARYLRLSGTGGLATGGAATHTHTGPSHTHTGTVDGHAITEAEMPAHTHNIPYNASGGGATCLTLNAPATVGYIASGSAGSNNAHTHTFTSAAGGTGNTGTNSADPLYVDAQLYQMN